MSCPPARVVCAVSGVLTVMMFACTTMAGGINLAWDDCGAAGSTNKYFACNTNVGNNDMYASFDPPMTLSNVNGNILIIDLQTAASSLAPWWQFKNAGSCRTTSLLGRQSEQFYCLDPWSGQGTPGIVAYFVTANTPSMPPHQARIIANIAVPSPFHPQVDPGTEYYSMVLRINNAKTVGTGACAGCQDPVCIILNEIMITQPSGTPGGSPKLTNPLLSHYVTWQGGLINTFGCPGGSPTVNRTWGQLKGLYR